VTQPNGGALLNIAEQFNLICLCSNGWHDRWDIMQPRVSYALL